MINHGNRGVPSFGSRYLRSAMNVQPTAWCQQKRAQSHVGFRTEWSPASPVTQLPFVSPLLKLKLRQRNWLCFPEPSHAKQKMSESILHVNDLKYISHVPQMDLKCTPSNFIRSRRFSSPAWKQFMLRFVGFEWFHLSICQHSEVCTP